MTTRPATTRTVRPRAKCAGCGAAVRAKDSFCSGCGTPIAAAQAPLPAPAGRAGAPPVAEPAVQSASLQVAAHARAALAEYRKIVTVLFADLSGSTPLAEKLDPEELRSIIGAYFSALSRQIQRYEGTVDKYIGDAIMAVFGAPLSHEDDAERAIHAALAMLGSLARLNDELEREHGVRLALRIGINTGEVVAGLLAGDVQSAYTVVGDAVNTAQRFESVAPLNGILVSESSRRLTVHSFEFETLPPVTLKGKAEPVLAYRVIRPRDEEIEPDASPLVGREREMERLRDALGGALVGRGRLVHVVGEAGIGKSRLVGEFRAQLAAGVERMGARCVSYEAQTPYALVSDLIRGIFCIHAADDEATAREALLRGLATYRQSVEESTADLLMEVLGYAERSTFDPEVKQRLLVAILRNVLTRAGELAPFVIAAEDLHWIDGASAAVLADLAKDVPGLPCLFITTSRPGWSPPWSAETIALEALSDEDARRLIEAIFEAPVDDALDALVRERTGGNPFFIEEVVRELKVTFPLGERAGRVAAVGPAAERLPTTVQEVLQARLDRLEAGPREAAETAAIVGRSFWYRLLEQLLPGKPLAPHLATLEHEAFIVTRAIEPELTYAFRQALIQEVAYQTQLLARRRAGHAAVGRALENLYPDRLDEFTDLLAYHYGRGDDAGKAALYSVRAGARARSLYANEEAIAYYRRALASAPGVDLRVAALEGLGDVLATTGELSESRASYDAALKMALDEVTRARLQRKTGGTFIRAGEYQPATEWLERALATLGARSETDLAATWLDIAHVAWRQGRYDDAIDAAQNGVARAAPAEAAQLLAEGYKHLGTAHVLKADHEKGVDFYRRSLEIYESLGDLQGLMNVRNNIGIVFRRQSRWDEALSEQDHALGLARRIGDLWGVGMALANMAETLRNRGDYERALGASEEALRAWSRVGNAAGVATVHMNIGILNFEHGRPDEARDALRTALAEWEKLDSRLFLPELYRTLAKVELKHDARAALGWAGRSVEVAREIGARDEEGIGLQVLGGVHAALDELDSALRELRQSVEILRSANNRLELARSLSALAAALDRARGDRDEVLALAREASAIFAALGATAEHQRTEALLART